MGAHARGRRSLLPTVGAAATNTAAAAHKAAMRPYIPDVVRCVRSATTAAQQVQAATELEQRLQDSKSADELRQAVVHAGGVGDLVQMLGSGSMAAQRATAAALWRLAERGPAIETALHAAGGIPALVQLLSGHDTAARFAATATLSCVAASPACLQPMAEAGAIPRLVQLLGSGDTNTQRAAAWALTHLCNSGPAIRTGVAKTGAIPKLVHLLSSTATAADALCSLACAPGHSRTIAAAGVIPALVARLGTHDAELGKSAAALLGRLAKEDSEVCSAVGQAGGVAALLSLVQRFAGSERVAAMATAALGNLLNRDSDNHAAFMAAGGIPVMLGLLAANGGGAVSRYAVMALLNLSNTEEHCAALVAAGAMPALVGQLESGASAAVLEHAAQTLHNLAMYPASRQAVAASGAARPLAQLLEYTGATGQASVRHAAAAALRRVGAAGAAPP